MGNETLWNNKYVFSWNKKKKKYQTYSYVVFIHHQQ